MTATFPFVVERLLYHFYIYVCKMIKHYIKIFYFNVFILICRNFLFHSNFLAKILCSIFRPKPVYADRDFNRKLKNPQPRKNFRRADSDNIHQPFQQQIVPKQNSGKEKHHENNHRGAGNQLLFTRPGNFSHFRLNFN